MKIMKKFFISLLASICSFGTLQAQETAYLFSYFINDSRDGLHLAYSRDGQKWTAAAREELAEIAHGHGLPLIEDLGSGAIVDLAPFGIRGEPTVQRSLRAGVDVASFSGDKLLGGPQAGLIVGKREYIERLKKHPLARALRLDKMTLAALHATLSAYLDAEIAAREIPTLAMLSASEDELHAKALRLQKALADTGVSSRLVRPGDAVGGGSAPAQELSGWAVAIEPGRLSVDELE